MAVFSNAEATDASRSYIGTTLPQSEILDGSLYMSLTTVESSSVSSSATPETNRQEPINVYASAGIDGQAQKAVRRPYRGISIKRESFASLSVVTNKSTLSKNTLKNSSSKDSVAFTSNFLINSVSESRQEKHQPVSTFGKDYVYFFGEQPRQMTFNCTLLNSDNFRWEEEWWENYENNFRGSRLAARSEQVRLRLDESIIYGYMLTCSTNKDSNNPHSVTLSFTIHVTEVTSTRPTKIGSHLVQETNAREYGDIDMNVTDVASPTFTIGKDSQTLRSRNIASYLKDRDSKPIGAVARFKNSIVGEGLQDLAAGYQEFIDFIYGRNIVLPADAAYAQFSSGNPSFAEGTEAYNILNEKKLLGETAVYGKGRAKRPFNQITAGSYTDNYDEYPYRSVVAELSKESATEETVSSPIDSIIKKISAEFNIPVSNLTAESDNAFNVSSKEKIRAAYHKTLASKAAFAAFQIGTGVLSNTVRKAAYDQGKYKVFPTEYTAIGFNALQYTE